MQLALSGDSSVWNTSVFGSYYFVKIIVVVFAIVGRVCCEKSLEENPIPIPYSFSYTAGRMPGHTDRVHAETSDGTGVIRGMFSYIDPRYKVRTVEYVADQNGFHPILITNPVSDTYAVAKAKEKHLALYNKIASQHQEIAIERGQIGKDHQGEVEHQGSNVNNVGEHPTETPTVEHARTKHFNLYQRIAQQHAKIAAERETRDPHDLVVSYQY